MTDRNRMLKYGTTAAAIAVVLPVAGLAIVSGPPLSATAVTRLRL